MTEKMQTIIRKLTVEFRDSEHLRKSYLSSTPYGGLMVPTMSLLQPGDIVELLVRCAGDDFERQIRGAVLWCRKDAGIAVMAGVGFFASEVEKRECLLSLCSKYLSAERERKNERYDLDFKVAYNIKDDSVTDYAKNISTGGFYIESQEPPPVGTDFIFKLYLPDEEKPVELPGRVVWLTDSGKFGVCFTAVDPDIRDRLEKVIKKVNNETSQNASDMFVKLAASN